MAEVLHQEILLAQSAANLREMVSLIEVDAHNVGNVVSILNDLVFVSEIDFRDLLLFNKGLLSDFLLNLLFNLLLNLLFDDDGLVN